MESSCPIRGLRCTKVLESRVFGIIFITSSYTGILKFMICEYFALLTLVQIRWVRYSERRFLCPFKPNTKNQTTINFLSLTKFNTRACYKKGVF